MKRCLPHAAVLLALSACHLHYAHGGGRYVDGVRLEDRHREVLEVDGWDGAGLAIDSGMGDVTVERSDGPTRIEADVWEVAPNDGYVVYRDGALVAESHTGEPVMIGDVHVWTSDPLPRLRVETGFGDVRVVGVTVERELVVSTGTGDLEMHDLAAPAETSLSTGMGDIRVTSLVCPSLAASTGMGNVRMEHVEGSRASVSSGMGDIDVLESAFESLDASTGMGDIDTWSSRCGRADLDTGLGSVRSSG